MIEVSVQTSVPWLSREKRQVFLRDGCSIQEMLKELGLDDKHLTNILVVVNGKNRMPDDGLGDGDSVVVLPVLCGG